MISDSSAILPESPNTPNVINLTQDDFTYKPLIITEDGIYNIMEDVKVYSIIITAENVTIDGNNHVIDFEGAASGITAEDIDDSKLVIKNCTFKNAINIIDVNKLDDVVIKNNEFTNFYSSAIQYNYIDNILIRDNLIDGAGYGKSGIYEGNNNVEANNTFVGNTIKDCYVGIYIEEASKFNVSNNTIQFNELSKTHPMAGISVKELDETGNHITYANNVFKNCNIVHDSDVYIRYIDMSNNKINGKDIGLFVNESSKITVDDSYAEIFVYNCTNVSIEESSDYFSAYMEKSNVEINGATLKSTDKIIGLLNSNITIKDSTLYGSTYLRYSSSLGGKFNVNIRDSVFDGSEFYKYNYIDESIPYFIDVSISNTTITNTTIENTVFKNVNDVFNDEFPLLYINNCTFENIVDSVYVEEDDVYQRVLSIKNSEFTNIGSGITLLEKLDRNCTIQNNVFKDTKYFEIKLDCVSDKNPYNYVLINDNQFEKGIIYKETRFREEYVKLENNTVNGKILKIVNSTNSSDTISSMEYGQLIIINCSNKIFKNINISNSATGITVIHSENITFNNVNVNNCYMGYICQDEIRKNDNINPQPKITINDSTFSENGIGIIGNPELVINNSKIKDNGINTLDFINSVLLLSTTDDDGSQSISGIIDLFTEGTTFHKIGVGVIGNSNIYNSEITGNSGIGILATDKITVENCNISNNKINVDNSEKILIDILTNIQYIDAMDEIESNNIQIIAKTVNDALELPEVIDTFDIKGDFGIGVISTHSLIAKNNYIDNNGIAGVIVKDYIILENNTIVNHEGFDIEHSDKSVVVKTTYKSPEYFAQDFGNREYIKMGRSVETEIIDDDQGRLTIYTNITNATLNITIIPNDCTIGAGVIYLGKESGNIKNNTIMDNYIGIATVSLGGADIEKPFYNNSIYNNERMDIDTLDAGIIDFDVGTSDEKVNFSFPMFPKPMVLPSEINITCYVLGLGEPTVNDGELYLNPNLDGLDVLINSIVSQLTGKTFDINKVIDSMVVGSVWELDTPTVKDCAISDDNLILEGYIGYNKPSLNYGNSTVYAYLVKDTAGNGDTTCKYYGGGYKYLGSIDVDSTGAFQGSINVSNSSVELAKGDLITTQTIYKGMISEFGRNYRIEKDLGEAPYFNVVSPTPETVSSNENFTVKISTVDPELTGNVSFNGDTHPLSKIDGTTNYRTYITAPLGDETLDATILIKNKYNKTSEKTISIKVQDTLKLSVYNITPVNNGTVVLQLNVSGIPTLRNITNFTGTLKLSSTSSINVSESNITKGAITSEGVFYNNMNISDINNGGILSIGNITLNLNDDSNSSKFDIRISNIELIDTHSKEYEEILINNTLSDKLSNIVLSSKMNGKIASIKTSTVENVNFTEITFDNGITIEIPRFENTSVEIPDNLFDLDGESKKVASEIYGETLDDTTADEILYNISENIMPIINSGFEISSTRFLLKSNPGETIKAEVQFTATNTSAKGISVIRVPLSKFKLVGVYAKTSENNITKLTTEKSSVGWYTIIDDKMVEVTLIQDPEVVLSYEGTVPTPAPTPTPVYSSSNRHHHTNVSVENTTTINDTPIVNTTQNDTEYDKPIGPIVPDVPELENDTKALSENTTTNATTIPGEAHDALSDMLIPVIVVVVLIGVALVAYKGRKKEEEI
ncbi:right-handed parallel beta-helix repeat-containing protein [Methanococcus voltae]|uniref:right-handed parallel beta-helix repeat-containing protein n=1 Tax=Methanococcus voltae TaxID=2188 RepID=UPI0018DCBE61|nr:right-handed parallel beta-helix repeat-containing protein [Methanococcus voltae]MCS3901234.1 parallel beta-helix repeat protein [Methanococcus voltae]